MLGSLDWPVDSQSAVRAVACVQVDLNDIESSTILSFRYIAEMGDGLAGLEKRQALKDWLELLARSHPLKRCGSPTLGAVLDQLGRMLSLVRERALELD